MTWRKKFLMALVCWMLFVPLAHADDSKVTHIVFRFLDPEVPEGHFALAPREMWRLGTRYLRMEEPPDPEKGVHILIIVDEPNSFLINRTNQRGIHMVDPGPTFNVHMPIFQFPRTSELSKLEFGRELEFFETRKAQAMPNVNDGGTRYKAYQLEIEGALLILFTHKASGLPAQLSLESKQSSYWVQYEVYETGLEPDMNLFAVPAGTKISEAEKHPSP